jgi:ATP-binding cassette, subfamily C, bacterial LapB
MIFTKDYFEKSQTLEFIFSSMQLGNHEFDKRRLELIKGVNIILGPSGCGKSTLLTRVLSLRGNSSVLVGDAEYPYSFHDIEPYVSYLSQDNFLVGKSFLGYLNYYGVRTLDENFYAQLLRAFSIDFLPTDPNDLNFEDNSINLSGGQTRKLLLIANLCLQKEIVLLDEPTSSLDNKSSKTFFDNLENFLRDRYVVIVSHDTKLISKYNFNTIELD